jgi:transposase-like protein
MPRTIVTKITGVNINWNISTKKDVPDELSVAVNVSYKCPECHQDNIETMAITSTQETKVSYCKTKTCDGRYTLRPTFSNAIRNTREDLKRTVLSLAVNAYPIDKK